MFLAVGYEAVQKDIQNSLGKQMKDLCSNWGDLTDEVNIICCSSVQHCVKDILPAFSLLAKSNNNGIFRHTWKKQMSAALRHVDAGLCELTQEKMCDYVWEPTVTFCKKFIYELKHKTIPISRVEDVFGDCQLPDIKSSTESLVKTLAKCFPKDVPSDTDWIIPVCEKINHFRLSLKCTECAEAILRLQSCLKLTGDFCLIKHLATQVSNLPIVSTCE